MALARANIMAVIPDLAGVAGGELSPETLAQSVAVTEAATLLPETSGGRVALAGVSVGGTLALLTAAAAGPRDRISIVTCIAPFGDLAEVMRLATTATYREGDWLEHHRPPPYLHLGLARSLAAMLPRDGATAALCRELRALDHESGASVELPRHPFQAAGPEAERLYALLANTDPGRFDALYESLPDDVREAVVALSPIHVARDIRAPIEIATAPRDAYFPAAQARALAAASPNVRLTVTSVLAHATPRLSLRYVAELRRLGALFVRALTATTDRAPATLR
jgi:pimeloyl-ACP methyl ester carboxylesterase